MNLEFSSERPVDYIVSTSLYQGPLDLLLHLIERAELDITKLAIAQITDQYLSYLENLQERAADEVSQFILIAVKLLQIKSEVLLPRPPEREEGEEDPGEALARQLIAYKRYKEIANILEDRDKEGLRTYLRLASPPKVETIIDFDGLNTNDLSNAIMEVYSVSGQKEPIDSVVTAPKITIRKKIHRIVSFIKKQGRTTFFEILERTRARLDVVVSFLAMLELVKLQRVSAKQSSLFSDIVMEPTEQWDESEEFELEFGE